MKVPDPYVITALDAGRRVQRYTPESAEAFFESELIQDAICMRLQEMGENLSKIRQQFPDYYQAHHSESWHRLIGLRNVISHGYGDIDLNIVWCIASQHLSGVMQELETLQASSLPDL